VYIKVSFGTVAIRECKSASQPPAQISTATHNLDPDQLKNLLEKGGGGKKKSFCKI
jgi:hypothetical protein